MSKRADYSCVCGKGVAFHRINEHTQGCSIWLDRYGEPFPYIKYSRTREHYASGAVEGVDYLQCKECLSYGFDVRFSNLKAHLRKHDLDYDSYSARYPSTPIKLSKTYERRVATVSERYGVENVFQLEETKEKTKATLLERYGVEHISQSEEIAEQRKQTNLERYGVENPFQATELVRDGFRAKYGVDHPTQVAEIWEKKKQTNLERYGAEHYLQTDEFKEKFRATSNERYGTDHPMQNEEIWGKQQSMFKAKYGVPTPFHSEKIQKKAYESNLANHNGVHSATTEKTRELCRQTCIEKYGVDNPSKSEEIKEKIIQTWITNYGVPFPPNSLWANQTHSFPNKLEQRVDSMTHTNLVYSGDHSYWVSHKGTHKAKNPDFILLSDEQLVAYQNGTDLNLLRTHTVVEVFGDYWHSEKITGKDRTTHKREVIEFYAKANVRCLVIWESEINKHPKRVQERIARFLGFIG